MRKLFLLTLFLLLLSSTGWAEECTSYEDCMTQLNKKVGDKDKEYSWNDNPSALVYQAVLFKLDEISEKLSNVKTDAELKRDGWDIKDCSSSPGNECKDKDGNIIAS